MLAMLTIGKDFCILNTHGLFCINALSREFGLRKKYQCGQGIHVAQAQGRHSHWLLMACVAYSGTLIYTSQGNLHSFLRWGRGWDRKRRGWKAGMGWMTKCIMNHDWVGILSQMYLTAVAFQKGPFSLSLENKLVKARTGGKTSENNL